MGDSDLFKDRDWTLLGPNKVQSRKILINLQKCSIGQNTLYLEWIILGAREFKFVQIKSQGSCMALPQGLKF